MSNVAESIIDRLGGTTKVAAMLSLAVSTVQSWKVSGYIPAQHQERLLIAALDAGLNLRPADFFPVASKRIKARQKN